MPSKALVIDASILVRAVLGKRVREVLETYAGQVSFFVPEVAYSDSEEHLPTLVVKHGGDPDKALRFLPSVISLVELIGSEVYGDFECDARERLPTPLDSPIGCAPAFSHPLSGLFPARHRRTPRPPCAGRLSRLPPPQAPPSRRSPAGDRPENYVF